jgi:hypothetical protein
MVFLLKIERLQADYTAVRGKTSGFKTIASKKEGAVHQKRTAPLFM